jgi:hypothetical protein
MDVGILRVAVIALGFICGLSLLSITTLAILGREIPPSLASMGGMAGGALVGICVPTQINRNSDSR